MSDQLWQLLIAFAVGSAAPWPLKAVWLRLRGEAELKASHEEHIAVLRKALDKAGIRQNAAVTVSELLLLAMDMVEELPPAAEAAKRRARDKLADVVRTLERISGGGVGR